MSSTTLPSTILTLRPAGPDDAVALARLAQLDSATVPAGALLLAVADGRPLAAISVDTGAVIADPFAPTAHLVAMLRERAVLLRRAATAPEAHPRALMTHRLGRRRRLAA